MRAFATARVMMLPMRIAIDTGGTFTDCLREQDGKLEALKLASTPDDPARAMLAALQRLGAAADCEIRHGTTVGTNTLLERSGARVALVTTAGFEDVIEIGRQARRRLYDWLAPAEPPLVGRRLRLGVKERVDGRGRVLTPLRPEELRRLAARLKALAPESIAVSLLYSFAHPAHERAIAAALAGLDLPLSLSHRILPEFREYERTAATVINAYLAPRMQRYLRRLEAAVGRGWPQARLQVMQSAGGILSAAAAAREPVRTLLSGPAGGVLGAWQAARGAGVGPVLSFDMGGTSTDVALIAAPGPRPAMESEVAGLPVAVPMLEIHTVGAGGGSIAWRDRGGAWQVGPRSAGAMPGPIAYGRGGEALTVTDAQLLLGRLPARLASGLALDAGRVAEAFARAARLERRSPETLAAGLLRLAEARMEKALRVVSLERGRDPREFTLAAFGGAGPLHACALAEALGMRRVLVPRLCGLLSAYGLLGADAVRDESRTVMLPPEPRLLEPHFRALERAGRAALRREGLAPGAALALRSLDLRYRGQGYELNLDWSAGFAAAFHRAHRRRYGYADPGRAIEVVGVRLRLVAAAPPLPVVRLAAAGRGAAAPPAPLERRRIFFERGWRQAPVYMRDALRAGQRFSGPALVTEYSATTLVAPGWRGRVNSRGDLLLER